MALVPFGAAIPGASAAGTAGGIAAGALGSLPLAGAAAMSAITYIGCKRRRVEPRAIAAPCTPAQAVGSPERFCSLEERMARVEARVGALEASANQKVDAKHVEEALQVFGTAFEIKVFSRQQQEAAYFEDLLETVRVVLDGKADKAWTAGQVSQQAATAKDLGERLAHVADLLSGKADRTVVDEVMARLTSGLKTAESKTTSVHDFCNSNLADLSSRIQEIESACEDKADKQDIAFLQGELECKVDVYEAAEKTKKLESVSAHLHHLSEIVEQKADADDTVESTKKLEAVSANLNILTGMVQQKADSEQVRKLKCALDRKADIEDVSESLDEVTSHMHHLTEIVQMKADSGALCILKNAVEGKANIDDVRALKVALAGKASNEDVDQVKDILEGKADEDELRAVKDMLSGKVSVEIGLLRHALDSKAEVDELCNLKCELELAVSATSKELHIVKSGLDTKASTEELSLVRDARDVKVMVEELTAKGNDIATMRARLEHLEENVLHKVDADELDQRCREIGALGQHVQWLEGLVQNKAGHDEVGEFVRDVESIKSHVLTLSTRVQDACVGPELAALREDLQHLEAALAQKVDANEFDELRRHTSGLESSLIHKVDANEFDELRRHTSGLESSLLQKVDGHEFDELRRDVGGLDVALQHKAEATLQPVVVDNCGALTALRMLVNDLHQDIEKKADRHDIERLALQFEERVEALKEGSELAAEQIQAVHDDVAMHIGYDQRRYTIGEQGPVAVGPMLVEDE